MDAFKRNILQQIRLNQTRSPTERLVALCELLDAARALAPRGTEARQRRLRVLALRERDRERLREQCRRWIAAQRSGASEGV